MQPTILIAAHNASNYSKARADRVCDGVNDEVDINWALSELPPVGGLVGGTEGDFDISGPINITRSNCGFAGMPGATWVTAGHKDDAVLRLRS